jgi:hypothetical protein
MERLVDTKWVILITMCCLIVSSQYGELGWNLVFCRDYFATTIQPVLRGHHWDKENVAL